MSYNIQLSWWLRWQKCICVESRTIWDLYPVVSNADSGVSCPTYPSITISEANRSLKTRSIKCWSVENSRIIKKFFWQNCRFRFSALRVTIESCASYVVLLFPFMFVILKCLAKKSYSFRNLKKI